MGDMRPPSSISGSDRPRPGDNVTTEVLDGEAVIHVEGKPGLHVLNLTASLIWQNLDGRRTLDELAASLSQLAGEPFDTVQRDVLEAVRDFGDNGLLQGIEATESADDLREVVGSTAAVSGDDLRFLPEPPHG